ncbi:MAG TPA: hypothetical protein PLD88_13960, partial [Candidatus Berkiella sp.]|nr:hypothetical protein [Candidatus Berkiella sp.]
MSIQFLVRVYDRIDMMLPRAFPDWVSFHIYVEESIIQILKDNNQTDWADAVFGALYVSQSYHERKGELLRALGTLKHQPFVKQLGIKHAVEKSISFLLSLGWIRVS